MTRTTARRTIGIVAIVALVAIAGCVGGTGALDGNGVDDGAVDDGSPDDGSSPTEPTTDSSADGESATMTFYVSDEPNRIGDFEHLNVTITKVGIKKAGGGETDDSDAGGDDEDAKNDSEESTEDGEDGADDEGGDANESEGSSTDEGDEKENGEKDGDAKEDEEKDGDEEKEDAKEDEEKDDGSSKGGDWIEYEVNDTTVDLTELQGDNATALDVLEVPEGEYEKVFVHVGEIEGILTDGTETNVKLPSEKLQINAKFTVEANETVDFVFDIAPHEAGKSGKYILKPVISQSGTGDDVEINDVHEDGDEGQGADEKPERNENAESDDDGDDQTDDEAEANDERDGGKAGGGSNGNGPNDEAGDDAAGDGADSDDDDSDDDDNDEGEASESLAAVV